MNERVGRLIAGGAITGERGERIEKRRARHEVGEVLS